VAGVGCGIDFRKRYDIVRKNFNNIKKGREVVMNKGILLFLGLAGVVGLCGCATTRSNQSVENRLQVLESKVQSLESGTASGQIAGAGSEVVAGKTESGVTAETMT
jgi:hypothetical protein